MPLRFLFRTDNLIHLRMRSTIFSVPELVRTSHFQDLSRALPAVVTMTARRVQNGRTCLTPEAEPFVNRFPSLSWDKQQPALHVLVIPRPPLAPSTWMVVRP